jgi:hypothetical protein
MRLARLAATASILFVPLAQADELYKFTANVDGRTTRFGFQTTQEAVDVFSTTDLSRFVAGYTGAEAVRIDVDYRGLPITTAFPNRFGGPANYAELHFTIPSMGIDRTFTGADRDASVDLLWNYLKDGNLLGDISKKLAAVSPVDPVAGNPNSMMSQLVANDFAGAFDAGSKVVPDGGKQGNPNLVGLGLRFGQYRQADVDSRSITLPLSYTIRSDLDPRRQLVISMPISRTEVQGSTSYYTGLGLAYRVPLTDNWSVTPAGNYAVTGSVDLGSMAQMASASLTSSYVFELGSKDLVIGNMVGWYRTLKFSHDGYSYDPGLSNVVFRNGAMLSVPFRLSGKAMAVEYSLIDTRFKGSELYLNNYHEAGITLGTNRSASSARSFLRAGATYLWSAKSKGFTLNLGYWF